MATVAIGKIGSIEGNVNVVHADGTTGSLQQGAIVYADDAISTGENSHTRIEFVDGSSLNIGPEFTATLSKDVFDPALIPESELVILDSSDRAVSPDSGHDTEGYGVRVGVVETTVGVVEAVDEDGAIRTLLAGDALYATDILKVGSDGDVSIRLVDGSDLSLGPNSIARMDDVDPTGISQVSGLTEPTEIEAAIIAGGDPTREAAAPAAGESGGNEGGLPVFLRPSDRAVTPDSGHETHGFELPFRAPEEDLFIPEQPDRGVIITDLTAKTSGGEATVFEENLTDGTDPDAAALSKTGDFTISAPDGVGSLVIGGVTVINAGGITGTPTVTTGLGNSLTVTGYNAVTGVVSYSYTLLDNENHPLAGNDSLFDDTDVVLTDTDGDTATSVLSIEVVDDVPEARNDTPDAVVEDDAAHKVASGNVVLDSDISSNDISGADTPASFTAWDTDANAQAEADLASYGTLALNPDGSYSFTLNNSLNAVQALNATDTLTFDLAYSMEDADGDSDAAILTITIEGTDDGVIITDLTAKASGGEATVFEENLTDGTDPDAAALSKTGDFTISALDGVGSLVIGGVTVIDAGGITGTPTVTTGLGNSLTVTGYNAATGVVSYSYTLLDNENHPLAGNDSLFDDTDVVLTDTDGDTATSVLSIEVVDDVPDARNDTPDAVVEDDAAHKVASGNVVLDSDISSNDISGADTPASFTAWDTDANAQAEADLASYGTLALNPDGSYSFTLNNSLNAVQALNATDTLTFDLAYSMEDADGDSDAAILTITIEGTDDGVIITDLTAKASGGEATVFEENLTDGTDPDAAALSKTGDFTISAPDGVGSLVIGGVTVINAGGITGTPTVTTGLGNSLTVTGYNAATGVVSYSYTLLDNENHPLAGNDSLFDDTDVVLTDTDGDTATSVLSIEVVDDVPDARNDTPDAVVEDDAAHKVASGNVVLDSDISSNDISGADTPASFTAWDTDANAQAEADLASYGTLALNPDGSYSFTLNNSLNAVQALNATDTLTFDLAYSMEDADGDSDAAILTITIEGTDDGVIITDLTAKASGGEATVFEENLTDGTDPDAAALSKTGDFTISALDGVGSLVIGGVTVINAGGITGTPTVTTGLGNSLTVTGYNAVTGVVSYSYTLLDNENHPLAGNDSLFDDTDVVLTDTDGDTATSVLSIEVVDDVPDARNDTPDAVVEDDAAHKVASGNVVLDSDISSNDISGADTPASFTAWDTDANAQAEADLASYGTLALNPDGSYSFTLNNSLNAVQALNATDTLTFDLAYSMEDADGDSDAAILTITIEGTDDGVIITDLTAKASGGEATVFEENLTDGTDPDAAALSKTGDFTISAPDGVGSLVIGGVTVIDAGGITGTPTVTTGLGNSLTVTGYNAATGVVSYSYTLLDNENHPLAGNDSLFDDTDVVLTDTDGDTATSVLSIEVVDDVPTARVDTDRVLVSHTTDGNVITGADANDPDSSPDLAEADIPGADGAEVTGVVAGDTGTQASGGVGAEILGTLGGTLTLHANGAYEYTAAPNVLGTDVFTYTLTDGDGDITTTTLSIDVGGLIVGSNKDDDVPDGDELHVVPNQAADADPSGMIQGGGGDDILIGDSGGATGIDANFILVLDSSGSMTNTISFDGGFISRNQALKNAANELLDNIAASDALNIRIHLIEFDSDANPLGGTYDIMVNGVVDEFALADARSAINNLDASGVTNYEAGLQEAIDYIEPGGALSNADVNQLLFISDGRPNRALEGDGTTSVISVSTTEALQHLTGSGDGDTISEIDTIENIEVDGNKFTIESVGINVDTGALDILSQVEGTDGVADNITTAEQLTDVILSLAPIVADVGADVINGGAGDDIIFGDVINTDHLSSATFGAAGTHDGEGYVALIAHLEDDNGDTPAGPDLGEGNVTNADVIDFISANLVDLAADGRGKSDNIDGGDGNDIIIGQGGDDNLTGGEGADTFMWVAGDTGTDTITDFDPDADGDVLNIADLLVDENLLDHSSNADLADDLVAEGYISIATGDDTMLTLFSNGNESGTPQVIELTGFNTTNMSTADVITSLLGTDSLIVD